MRFFAKNFLVLLVGLLVLAGCVSTRVSGERTSVLSERITRLGVCFKRTFYAKGNAASTLGNELSDAMSRHLVARVPVVFADNGIESQAAVCAQEGTAVAPELSGFAQILKITPRAAQVGGFLGTRLEVDAEIFQKPSGQMLWRGEITLRPKFAGKFDAELADELAGKLLTQLYSDRVINPPRAVLGLQAPAAVVAASAPALVPMPAPAVAPLTHRTPVPEASGFAAVTDVEAVPVSERGKQIYRQYLASPTPKAFVVYEDGGSRRIWGDRDAMTKPLEQCTSEGRRCWLYAVDDRVVWSADVAKRIGSVAPLAPAKATLRAPAPVSAAASETPLSHRLPVPGATSFAAIEDANAVPLRSEGQDGYRRYLTVKPPKAFVIYEDGGWIFVSHKAEAMTLALDQCARKGKRCWLYAVDDQVVWSADVGKRVGTSAQLRAK